MKTTAQLNPQFTTTPIAQAISATPIRPEFIRLPKPGTRCPYTGMSRSYLNLLVLPCDENDFKPPVKSYVLRRRGNIKGVRLIDYDGLINHIQRHVEPTYQGPETATP